jgi:hypothetical protein
LAKMFTPRAIRTLASSPNKTSFAAMFNTFVY